MNTTRIRRNDYIFYGILWRGEPFSSTGVALRICRGDFLGASVTVGGTDEDGQVSADLFGIRVSAGVEQSGFGARLRERTRAWAVAKAASLNAHHPGDMKVFPFELDPMSGRTTGFYVSRDGLYSFLWHHAGSWSASDVRRWPWNGNGWRTGLTRPESAVVVEEEVVVRDRVHLPGLDESYEVEVTLERLRVCGILRSRRVWTARVHVLAEGGIPAPSRFDAQDAAYSWWFTGYTARPLVAEVLGRVRADVLKDRVRWGVEVQDEPQPTIYGE